MIYLQMKIKAFSAEPATMQEIAIDKKGTVRVWDDVASAYTICHILTLDAINAARVKRGQPTIA